MKFEIRQIDAYVYDDSWIHNTTYLLGTMTTNAANERRAFTDYLRRQHGIIFRKNRTRIEFDGDCYTIEDRKTHEPLFIAIPMI